MVDHHAAGGPSPPVEVEAGRRRRPAVAAEVLGCRRSKLSETTSRLVAMTSGISRSNDEQVRSRATVLLGTPETINADPPPARRRSAGAEQGIRTGRGGITNYFFGQLADVLAEAGFIVLRYDRRGVGRVAAAKNRPRSPITLEDLRAAETPLATKGRRGSRIAVIGYRKVDRSRCWPPPREVTRLALVATTGVTARSSISIVPGQDRTNRSSREAGDTDLQNKSSRLS